MALAFVQRFLMRWVHLNTIQILIFCIIFESAQRLYFKHSIIFLWYAVLGILIVACVLIWNDTMPKCYNFAPQ